eukprot:gene2381-2617_t
MFDGLGAIFLGPISVLKLKPHLIDKIFLKIQKGYITKSSMPHIEGKHYKLKDASWIANDSLARSRSLHSKIPIAAASLLFGLISWAFTRCCFFYDPITTFRRFQDFASFACYLFISMIAINNRMLER